MMRWHTGQPISAAKLNSTLNDVDEYRGRCLRPRQLSDVAPLGERATFWAAGNRHTMTEFCVIPAPDSQWFRYDPPPDPPYIGVLKVYFQTRSTEPTTWTGAIEVNWGARPVPALPYPYGVSQSAWRYLWAWQPPSETDIINGDYIRPLLTLGLWGPHTSHPQAPGFWGRHRVVDIRRKGDQ